MNWESALKITKGLSGIYAITNKANGKVYIGESSDIKIRWHAHIGAWRNKEADIRSGRNQNLHSDMRKFGKENFDFSILEHLPSSYTEEQLVDRENFYIKKYNAIESGYNISPAYNVGDGKELSVLNVEKEHDVSKETLTKLLETMTFQQIGKKFSVTGNAVRRWCKLYGMSTHSGDYMTDAKRATHRKLMQKVTNPPFTKKPLVAVDNKTGEVKGYASAEDAGRALGTSSANIKRAINGKPRLTSLGRKWYTTDMFKGTLPEVFEEVPLN